MWYFFWYEGKLFIVVVVMWFIRMTSLIKMIVWLYFIYFIECGVDSCGGWGENIEGWGGCF